MSLSADASRVQPDTPQRPSSHRVSAAPRLLAELRRRAAETVDGAVVVTRAELACSLGCTDRTIKRARRDLVATGLIEVFGAEEAEPSGPNTYRLVGD